MICSANPATAGSNGIWLVLLTQRQWSDRNSVWISVVQGTVSISVSYIHRENKESCETYGTGHAQVGSPGRSDLRLRLRLPLSITLSLRLLSSAQLDQCPRWCSNIFRHFTFPLLIATSKSNCSFQLVARFLFFFPFFIWSTISFGQRRLINQINWITRIVSAGDPCSLLR